MPRTTLAQLAKQRFTDLRAKTRSTLPQRATPAERGYDARWRRRRLIQLKREPLCRICKAQGRITPATEVDHIVPLSAGGPDAFSNYQELCASCHAKKTVREDGGFGKRITYEATHSVYQALSADAPTKEGLNASFVLFDELHAQRDRDLWDRLYYAGRVRRQPLHMVITTAGTDREAAIIEGQTPGPRMHSWMTVHRADK